jgi:Fur family ferric uptake transcriptional regulator
MDLKEGFRQRLREAGLRATAARVAVLDALTGRAAPLSHAELVEELGQQGWDRATLYRNLTDMAEAGILRRSDMGDHLWRYELQKPEKEEHGVEAHPHFLCTTCGEVSCLPDDVLTLQPDPRLPKALQSGTVELQVRGICDRCDE